MKNLLFMALVLLFVNGCEEQQKLILPKVFTIDAKLTKLEDRNISYVVYPKDVNITTTEDCVLIPYKDAEWFNKKMDISLNNTRKCMTALEGTNKQLRILGAVNLNNSS